MGRNINNLRPDGHGWRARLGVLTHDDSAISESELWTMAPDGVSLHIGVITALEEDLRRPVLTANQVSLWYALRMAGAEVSVDDYGQLFKMPRR